MEEDSTSPKMKSMHVLSTVRNRYARTVVTSQYSNQNIRAQQATFSIVLPDTAFIAGFVMKIKGKRYEAFVKEKEEANQIYQEAVFRGQAAAHVAVSARDSNNFTVSVNVEPYSDVTFILTYEELLVRKHGKYELLINLHPEHFLDDLRVDVHINETRPIINVETPAVRSGNNINDKASKNKYAVVKKNTKGLVHVTFHPTVEEQKDIAKALAYKSRSNGVTGQFIVEYDVERDPLGGEVLVNDGYFVHFFAPTDLKPIPKHIVFVLDISGSMGGRKLRQLKEAMKVILSELNFEDYFNIIKFNENVQVLHIKKTLQRDEKISLPATIENINKAQNIVECMTADGQTNICDALISALGITLQGISYPGENLNLQPIIVFLTDGQANNGDSNTRSIIKKVEKINCGENKSAIFTLAFGNDANKEFLKELAMKNSGFLRNIYEAADASLQLQDFYKQISSPLLTNVNFKYSEEVKETTKRKFDILFGGSEFVVTGKVNKMDEGFVIVEGSTLYGIDDFRPAIIPVCPTKEEKKNYGSLERLWAYMTIKQLLDKKYEKNATSLEMSKREALKLALKYSFVTPVTSLVVVKPDKTDEIDLQWGSVQVESMNSFYQKRVRLVGGGGPATCAAQTLDPQLQYHKLRGGGSATCAAQTLDLRKQIPRLAGGGSFASCAAQTLDLRKQIPRLAGGGSFASCAAQTLNPQLQYHKLRGGGSASCAAQTLDPQLQYHKLRGGGSASCAAQTLDLRKQIPRLAGGGSFASSAAQTLDPMMQYRRFVGGGDPEFMVQGKHNYNLRSLNISNTRTCSPKSPELKSMHVVSNVQNRYASTVLTTKYVNQETRALQAMFSIMLPENAYVTGFVMKIKGKKYEANMTKKEKNKERYQQAVVKGLAAAHITCCTKNLNKYTVSINVEQQSEIIIILSYEQRLIKKNNKYAVITNLYQEQRVEDLQVNIKISDYKPIVNIEPLVLTSNNTVIKSQIATVNKNYDGSVDVSFKATDKLQNYIIQSKQSDRNKDISGQFVVKYEIKAKRGDKEIIIDNVPSIPPLTNLVIVKS